MEAPAFTYTRCTCLLNGGQVPAQTLQQSGLAAGVAALSWVGPVGDSQRALTGLVHLQHAQLHFME